MRGRRVSNGRVSDFAETLDHDGSQGSTLCFALISEGDDVDQNGLNVLQLSSLLRCEVFAVGRRKAVT